MSQGWKVGAAMLALAMNGWAASWQVQQTGTRKGTGGEAVTAAAGTSVSLAATSSGAATKAGATKAGEQEPTDTYVTHMKARQDFIGTILKESPWWALVSVVVLFYFRKEAVKLLQTIIAAIPDRGVTVDIGTVKLQVTDRPLDAPRDRPWFFSMSPFDIDGTPPPDRISTLNDIGKQLTFGVSEYVGLRWKTGHEQEAEALKQEYLKLEAKLKYLKLEAKLKTSDTYLTTIRPLLVNYARALEGGRFLHAKRLVDLFNANENLRKEVFDIQPAALPAGAEDYLILHAAGTAYAQLSDWSDARALLDKIAWKDDNPNYLPAGDTWIACVYHDEISKSAKADSAQKVDSYLQELQTIGEDALTKLDEIREAMELPARWSAMPSAPGNIPYYKREIQKVVGTIAGIIAECAETQEDRLRFFAVAEIALQQAVGQIDREGPSALDHNNLADLYHQMGPDKYDQAQQEMDKAFSDPEQRDSTFYETQAKIYWKRKEPKKALQALQLYDESKVAGPDADDLDVAQYIDNQIFAAKLAAQISPSLGDVRYARAVELLEGARQFLQRRGGGEDKWNDELGQLDELLGFTYLKLAGNESNAVEAFGRLHQRGGECPTQVLWHRRLGLATALTRLARVQRKKFSSDVALQYRERAGRVLSESVACLRAFGFADNRQSRRKRHFLIHLDTLVAIHTLAEEIFHAGEYKASRDLVDQESPILTSLRQAFTEDLALQQSLGEDEPDIRKQIDLNEAQRCFLLGLILIQSDPEFKDVGLIDRVDANLTAARGIGPDLDCRIDLALGEMYLSAALAGVGDVAALYDRSLRLFELAAMRECPALRHEAIKALGDAHARGSAILRKAKASKAAG